MNQEKPTYLLQQKKLNGELWLGSNKSDQLLKYKFYK